MPKVPAQKTSLPASYLPSLLRGAQNHSLSSSSSLWQFLAGCRPFKSSEKAGPLGPGRVQHKNSLDLGGIAPEVRAKNCHPSLLGKLTLLKKNSL